MPTETALRGQDTSQAIIQAAHPLFVHQGYHGTSMRQISKKTGIALGGLYNHFESKEAVFQAVFRQYHPYHEVIPAILVAQQDTLEEFVHDAIGRMIAAMDRRPEFLNLLFIEMVEFKNIHANELFIELMPKALEIVQRVIRENRDRLRPIPTLMLYRLFFGLFLSYYLTEAIFARQSPPEFHQDAQQYFVDAFLHGILKDDPADNREPNPP